MHITVVSRSATFDTIKQLLEKEGNSATLVPKLRLDHNDFSLFDATDLVIASHAEIPKNDEFHEYLNSRGIPYIFCNKNILRYEEDRFFAKQVFKDLGIRTPSYRQVDGNWLKWNFKKIPKPFVVKIPFVKSHGRQTAIITNDNYESWYRDYFENENSGVVIRGHSQILIEQYQKISYEYASHFVVNDHDCRYLGSVKPYKRAYADNLGPNTDGMGAVTQIKFHDEVQGWMERLADHMRSGGTSVSGIMHLGIGVDAQDQPLLFEINTRPGHSLHTVLSTIDDPLTDIFHSAAINTTISTASRTTKRAVSANLVNRSTRPDPRTPSVQQDRDIIVGIEHGGYTLRHSTYTSISDDLHKAVDALHQFLDAQDLGDFYYRRDIGKDLSKDFY